MHPKIMHIEMMQLQLGIKMQSEMMHKLKRFILYEKPFLGLEISRSNVYISISSQKVLF